MQSATYLELALTGIARHALRSTVSIRRSHILALEVDEESLIRLVEGTRAAKGIELARVSEIGRTDLVRIGIGRGEQVASQAAGLNGGIDVLEDIALSENRGTSSNLKSVTGRVIPVVVDGVKERVAADLRAASAKVVDVVTLQRDHVVAAVQIQAPVVVSVTGRGVVGHAIEVVVRDGHPVAGVSAEHDVLARDARGCNVVDPDHVNIIQSNGIAAPDILGVDVGDGNIPWAVRTRTI